MANKVLLKKSSTAAKVPLVGDLDYGELALNYTDGKLYYKTASNTIKSFTDDTSVVTLTGTQTLTNKTLTTPVVNRIDWAASGTGAPTFTTRSDGTKLTLYPSVGASSADYAIGINAATLWSSIPTNASDHYFKWYGGETEVASLSGTGNLTALGNITASGDVLGAYLRSTNSSGDEGGEILLYKPQTNTVIAGTGVTIDIYQNKIRFFEQGGSARGAYIDISAAGAGVSSSLLSGGATVNSFSSIAVSGQTSVAADSSTDTLTLVAGDGITLTTDHTTDSITITGSGAYSGLKEISQTGISTSTTVYSASATTYRGAKYTIQITNSTAYAMYEFLVMHDGTGIYFPYSPNAYAGDAGGNFQNYFHGDYLDSIATTKIQVGNTYHALNWAVSGGNLVFSASCSSGTIDIKGTALLIKA
jgi:hypothetical protein